MRILMGNSLRVKSEVKFIGQAGEVGGELEAVTVGVIDADVADPCVYERLPPQRCLQPKQIKNYSGSNLGNIGAFGNTKEK